MKPEALILLAVGLVLLGSSPGRAAPPAPPAPPAPGKAAGPIVSDGRPGFLDWGPGGAAGTTAAPSAPVRLDAPGPGSPKKGERWQTVYLLNRELSYFEKQAAKDAFTEHLPNQALESLTQSHGPNGWAVTVLSVFRADSPPIPIGQTLTEDDIHARLVSAARV